VTLRALAASAALGLALAGAARAEEPAPAAPKVRVGLEKLRAAGVTPAYAEAVEERVCAALAELPRLEVICPADVAAAALLAQRSVIFGECSSDECVQRVEAMRAADRRVVGALEKGEKGLVLSLQVSSPDGPGPRVAEKVPEDLEALFSKVPGIVKKLFP
jgi:hypothetical protein